MCNVELEYKYGNLIGMAKNEKKKQLQNNSRLI